MAIAMKDLEIRGAGNLLGGEQSGHIADVGFDLYVRLVGEAVAEFRGDAEPELDEVRIELPVDAHLPHDYIPSERLRLEMYKRLAEVRTDEDVDLLREELVDRYGEPPSAGRLAAAGRAVPGPRPAGRDRARSPSPGKNVRFAPVDLPESRVVRLSRLYPESHRQGAGRARSWCRGRRPPASGDARSPAIALLEWARQVIDAVIDPPASSRATRPASPAAEDPSRLQAASPLAAS